VLKHKYLILSIGWVCFITYLSLFNLSDAPKVEIDNFDKYVHTTFHFINTLLVYLFIKYELDSKWIKHCLILAMFVDVVYGVVIEVLQGTLTTTRHMDYMDVLFNTLGTILASLVVKFIIEKAKR